MDTTTATARLRKLIAELQKSRREADRLNCSEEVSNYLQAAIDELEDAYIANANYLNGDNA